MADSRFSFEHELCECEVPIFDMNGYTLRHLTKTVLGVLRIYMKFVQEAHPVRIRQIHVINCPSYLDKVMMVAKPFIKGEVFKLVRRSVNNARVNHKLRPVFFFLNNRKIKFHSPNSETLYEFFPQEMLPDEYGGKAGSIQTLRDKWIRILKEKR